MPWRSCLVSRLHSWSCLLDHLLCDRRDGEHHHDDHARREHIPDVIEVRRARRACRGHVGIPTAADTSCMTAHLSYTPSDWYWTAQRSFSLPVNTSVHA